MSQQTPNTAVSAAELARVNAELGRDAQALVAWALGLGQRAIVTTNFRPFEAVILHLVTRVQPDVPVIWMDNGYNTEATYRFADAVTRQLGLNLQIYLPKRSRAHREAVAAAQQHGLAEGAAVGELGEVQLDARHALQGAAGGNVGQFGVVGDLQGVFGRIACGDCVGCNDFHSVLTRQWLLRPAWGGARRWRRP